MKPSARPELTDATRLLLIAGAPRCGTSAMSRYLGKHPAICLSQPKETHFFLDPTSADNPALTRERYRRNHFADLRPEHAVLLDGSISYLYSPDAAARALRVFPQARFVVMLRNPVDLIHSYHNRLLFYRQESQASLPAAWALEDARRAGREIPRFCSDPRILEYSEVGSLGKHLERFLETVGRHRCHWVFYDDLAADVGACYRAVLAFAGVADDGRTSFPRKAANSTYRNGWAQFIYSGAFLMPLLPVGAGSTAFYGRLARWTKPMRKRLRSLNTRKVERSPLDRETRAMLLDAFASDIARLARLTGRNLDSWLAVNDAPPAVSTAPPAPHAGIPAQT